MPQAKWMTGRLTMQQHAARKLRSRRGGDARKAPPLSLVEFWRKAWPLIEPADLVWEPHMDVMAAHGEALVRFECKRLLFNQPPGTSKSVFWNVILPAWVWSWDPARKFIYSSYASQVIRRDSAKFETILESDWYTTRWGDQEGKQWSASMMTNPTGGFRFATTVVGQVTGIHADHQFVDDPIKPQDAVGVSAQSGIMLERVYEWWTQTMPTRMTSIENSTRCIIMQRIADADLTGRMLEDGGWHHVCLPMEYNPEKHTKTPWGEDWRTEKGEALAPIRFPPSAFPKMKKELGGPQVVAAQWQQDPVPEGGEIFKKEWLEHKYTTIPTQAVWLASVDATFKATAKSDYVCIQVWAYYNARYYLVDMVLERLSYTETKEAILETLIMYPQVSTVLVEDKANGTAIEDDLTTGKYRIPGMVMVNPLGDKTARLISQTGYFAAGDVYMPEEKSAEWMAWGAAFKRQITRFPRAKNDDAVDCASQAMAWMTGTGLGLFGMDDAMRAVREQEQGAAAAAKRRAAEKPLSTHEELRDKLKRARYQQPGLI